MGFTRRAVVNPIQIGREYCLFLEIQMHLDGRGYRLF